MANSQLSGVIKYVRSIVRRQEAQSTSDGCLLELFITQKDEGAFERLLRRHGPMVMGVCRRVLRNLHDADDAFQATFLVLVRKAGSVRPREMVGNWLYGVAHRTALEARRAAAKRRAKERQVVDMPRPQTGNDRWEELRPVLDQELTRLPNKYRTILVLCDLEGKTRKEVARQLALPEGTVASRLASARTMLAKRLSRLSLVVSGGALASVLSQYASACVSPSVMFSTIKAASLIVAGQAAATGVISAKVVALTEGVIKTMLITKLKVATVLVLAVVAFIGAGMTRFGLPNAGGRTSHSATTALAPQPNPQDERSLLALPTQASPLPVQPKKDRAEADMERIKGTWQLVKLEINGVELPFAFGQPKEGSLATFAGEKWTTNFMEGKGFTFKLDPATKPKAIDLHPLESADKTLLGIYQLNGDDLMICFCKTGKQERPSVFKLYWRAASHTALLVLKRQVHQKEK